MYISEEHNAANFVPSAELAMPFQNRFTKFHFAYSVTFSVTVSLAKVHTVLQADSLYQPPKLNPSFVGGIGDGAREPDDAA